MTTYFCISVRFLLPYSHGRDENDEPEWPPSPLRAFQAIVAASAGRWNEQTAGQLCVDRSAMAGSASHRPQIVQLRLESPLT